MMVRYLVICVLGLRVAAGAALLPEGTVLRGVDGALVRDDGNDVWRFELIDDVNDPAGQAPAGTALELLPSGTLAQMVADANERLLPQYRVNGQVTDYRAANFLLVSHYLPLSKIKDANEPDRVQVEALPPDRPRGALVIPEEALELLQGRRPARRPGRAQASAGATSPPSGPTRVLVQRTGSIESRDGRWRFVPDGLGWNVSAISYELLPSRVFEQTQATVRASLNPIRFSVSGLVTEYEGVQYLILQRAVRVYDYGNFN